MPIITIDNYNDQFENTLEKELECYFPNEIWEIIKEFNDWTQDRREIQNKLAKKNQKTGLYENVVGHRAGRIAPPIKIGDEITNGGRLCGRVVKINKASVDIDRYSFVDYRRVVVIDTKPNVVIINTISAYNGNETLQQKNDGLVHTQKEIIMEDLLIHGLPIFPMNQHL